MDVNFFLAGERFVWDSQKDLSNRVKHGISFQLAAEVFLSPFTEYADASVESEQREAAIGPTFEFLSLYVVHVIRFDNAIRIISARPTTSIERSAYENNE